MFTCRFCDLSQNFVKMARLLSNSEYVGVVLAYGEVCESAPRAQRISVQHLLVGVHEELGIFDVIDTIEVLRERVGNTATTIRNNTGMLETVEESFRRCLH
jgi:hypothetical protein